MDNTVILIKAREHKVKYIENIEDVRLGYVDAILKKNGIGTSIIDLSFCDNEYSDEEIIKHTIEKKLPLLIIFFIDKHPTNGPAYTMELIDKLTNVIDISAVHISLYGNTQIGIEEFFTHNVDSVIVGEEDSALSLAKSIIYKQPITNVEGIAFIDDNKVVKVIPASLKGCLDDLPFPTRYVLKKNGKVPDSYCASVLGSRGCFGQCTYCYLRSKEKYFGSYPLRTRSINNIVDEMEWLYKFGVREFYFSDDEFLQKNSIGLKRAVELSEEIKKRNLLVNYSIYSRADCINEDVVSCLVNSGLYCVFLGVESFSQSVLDRYNKGLSVKNNLDAIKILKRYNVHIRLGMIMFDMFTTLEELKENINNMKGLLEDKPELIFQSLFFSNVLIPLEGTPSKNMFDCIDETQIISNETIQETYTRRSRCGLETYYFADKQVADIYYCTSKMAEALLAHCIQDENKIYHEGYSAIEASRLLGITSLSIKLIDCIYEAITTGKTTDTCMVEVNSRIMDYYNANRVVLS